ncbi:MAG: GyrI-like domain-containing protein [Oscillospiraceae bacterium]|nr:GyrI-like domain-containing protein [Oscillospiraceae bacterium]
MFSIVRVYRESLPAVRFVGKKYGEHDRAEGSFAAKWGEWFSSGWFSAVEKEIELIPKECEGGAYIGLMRQKNGNFEYWIGMFAAAGSPVPLGFSYVDIPSGEIATAWIYGSQDNGEIYGKDAHDACLEKFADKGWQFADDSYFFERYQCPRFTNADKDQKVILDYCIYLKK